MQAVRDEFPEKTVTLGLLTGRFATAGADENSGEQDTACRRRRWPSLPWRTRRTWAPRPVASCRSCARPKPGHPSPRRAAAASGTAQRLTVRTSPAHDTTSSLTGKADIRYYREVARLGAQVADALAYAHKRGVLHRDIKPPNLILDALGNIWVTDFGLAKFEEGDDLSQSQDLVGTLRYMAPERFRGISDRRGDLYALGATLYELLTFRPAFEG